MNDNHDIHLDIMNEEKAGIKHNAKLEAKKFIDHFTYTRKMPIGEITTLKATNVSKAIRTKCFAFINGIIKASK